MLLILQQIIRGIFLQTEITEELDLTYASVKHHFDVIFKLMGVHSRAQALLKATRRLDIIVTDAARHTMKKRPLRQEASLQSILFHISTL